MTQNEQGDQNGVIDYSSLESNALIAMVVNKRAKALGIDEQKSETVNKSINGRTRIRGELDSAFNKGTLTKADLIKELTIL